MITEQQLSGYLGKSIDQICPNGYTRPADDHGAHFVGHVLGYCYGATCLIGGAPRGPAASLRVDEIFQRCPKVGVWGLRPWSLQACLVFISRASSVNLAARVMTAVPRRHIGIFVSGHVWHYSNREGKVVRQTPARFSVHFVAPDNAMFYRSLA